MRTIHQQVFAHRAARVGFLLLGAVPAWICGLAPSPALAIPSPELVIGSLSSISQLVTLLTAMLGGGAAIVGARTSRSSLHPVGSRRWAPVIVGGIVLVCAISFVCNVHQWFDYRDERTSRLEATLLRPAHAPGVPKHDPSLKELSFNEQLKHSLGLSTTDADARLAAKARGEASNVEFLDVRETAETEMGTLPGAHAIRYQDISPAALDLTGKQAVLFCHNGNRSRETCEALAAQGISCRFIIGGMEKWVVEGRRLTGLQTRTLGDLRAVPPYRNQRTLLETTNVHDLVQKDTGIFVDVRYPGEFAAGHLPGAVNLPIRRLPTATLKAEIERLPKRPIILPCYDRRGCFSAEVLGLELSRAGHDVRGRYTLPFEYFVAAGRPPHVEQWLIDNQRNLWSKGVGKAADLVALISAQTGLLMAIMLMALGSRLLVLPLSLKAERDQVSARRLTAEMAALKDRLKDDPHRRSLAIRAFYRRHGLTPGRNLLALLFLPLMSLAVAGVHHAAGTHSTAWLWLPDLAARDPYFVLPAIFGALIAAYLHITIAQTRRQRAAAWMFGVPVMMAAAALLSAAADVYLIVSAVLLLTQRAVVTWNASAFTSLRRSIRVAMQRLRLPGGVVCLQDVDRLVGCGNKAYRLARLKADGIDVPDGLVLTSTFLERFETASPRSRRRLLNRLWRAVDAPQIAVRSSAAAEDGDSHSFAGVFESVLNVDRVGLEAAIAKVKASFAAAGAASYGVDPKQGNILLQRMIDAEYAGVLFTRDPASAGTALIELVTGTAEHLVSGAVAPSAFWFGRYTLTAMDEARPPIDLVPLLVIGQRAERLFGSPQDIEWTYRNGRFQIVQSRNITRLHSRDTQDDLIQGEWTRLFDLTSGSAPDAVVFAQNELSEMLPQPTPLTLSLMEKLWSSGGSIDLACRRLGLAYRVEEDAPSYLLTVVGRLFVDKRQALARAPQVGPVALRRLERSADAIEHGFREQFLPTFSENLLLLEAVDFDRLSTPDLFAAIERLRDSFVVETHAEVDIINIAASFYLDRARADLIKHGLDPALCLARVPQPATLRAIVDAEHLSGTARRDFLCANFGHRAMLDYELAQPRFAEDEVSLNAFCGHIGPAASVESNAEDPTPSTSSKALKERIDRARRFQALKEDAKHHSLRELAVMRRAILALDRKLAFDGLVFYLTFDELLGLPAHPLAQGRDRAMRRKAEAELLTSLPPPQTALTLRQLEQAASRKPGSQQMGTNRIAGTRVSGSRVVEGRVHLVSPADAERGMPIDGFEPGDIIVSRMFHPAWLPHLRSAGGIVCELGGWLSHMALLAREHDVPMIVGTQGLPMIPDRALVHLHKDGSIEVISRVETGFLEAAE